MEPEMIPDVTLFGGEAITSTHRISLPRVWKFSCSFGRVPPPFGHPLSHPITALALSRTRQLRNIHERLIPHDGDLNCHSRRLSRQTTGDSALINRSDSYIRC
jgi:hypothetical protein